MLKADNASISNIQIHKDKMKLTVTNIYPTYQKKSKQEILPELSAKLYPIFIKYASSVSGGN